MFRNTKLQMLAVLAVGSVLGYLAAAGKLDALAQPPAKAPATPPPGSPAATTTIDGRYLPPPPQRFKGEIAPNALQSKAYWPARVVPPKGAPNVLLIMTDDKD